MTDSSSDEAAIRGLVDAFTEGWNAHDGKACARRSGVLLSGAFNQTANEP